MNISMHVNPKGRKPLGMLPHSWKGQCPENPASISVATYHLTNGERGNLEQKVVFSKVYLNLPP